MKEIVLIEDDPFLGAMIREMLEVRNHHVTWFSDGSMVLQRMARDLRPDLILTDIVMPEMDGLEIIQSLRDAWPDIPVIAMSADTGAGYLALAKRMGAKAVLQKPFTLDSLLGTIGELLNGPGDDLSPDALTRSC